VRDGPAVEGGWLALRTALALGLGGYVVTLWLTEGAVAFGMAGIDVRAWSGGDPGEDLDGLIGDIGADACVDADGGVAAAELRDGVRFAGRAELLQLYRDAELVLAP
jgi:hypothetical protein